MLNFIMPNSSITSSTAHWLVMLKRGRQDEQCPAGQAKDWAGICYLLKECKGFSAQPGTCTQSEEEKTNGMLTGALQVKKPATSSNPVSENCLKTETKSGESLCLTKGTVTPATTPNKETEKPVPEPNCKGLAGTKNGIGSYYVGQKEVNGECVPSRKKERKDKHRY